MDSNFNTVKELIPNGQEDIQNIVCEIKPMTKFQSTDQISTCAPILSSETNLNSKTKIQNDITPISPNKKPNIKDFEIMNDLGRGAYAKVCLARYIHNNKMIALKILDKSFMNKLNKSQEALIEREILTLCDHHNIIKLLSTFHDKRKLYFVLEYAPNKDLATFLRCQGILSFETAQFFAAQVLNVIVYLHQKNIAHRDLKPENIVLDSNMHIKLVLFYNKRWIFQQQQLAESILISKK